MMIMTTMCSLDFSSLCFCKNEEKGVGAEEKSGVFSPLSHFTLCCLRLHRTGAIYCTQSAPLLPACRHQDFRRRRRRRLFSLFFLPHPFSLACFFLLFRQPQPHTISQWPGDKKEDRVSIPARSSSCIGLGSRHTLLDLFSSPQEL